MSKCECEQCAAPDHPEDCECGACEALLMVTVWEDVIDQRRVSRLCESRHGVEITSEGWPGCSVMSSDEPPSVGIRVQVQASWTVAHILAVASRFQAAEAMLLAHDASCFCAACLTKQKDAS